MQFKILRKKLHSSLPTTRIIVGTVILCQQQVAFLYSALSPSDFGGNREVILLRRKLYGKISRII